MKKYFLVFLILIFLFTGFSCEFLNTEDEEKVLDEAKDSIANNENGLI